MPSPQFAGSFAFITSEYLILAVEADRLYMLSLDKAQISLVIVMRPRQPFLCVARDAKASSGCRMLPIPPTHCSFSASGTQPPGFRGLSALPTSELSFLPCAGVMWAAKRMGVHADTQARQRLMSSTVTGGFATHLPQRDTLTRHLLLGCLQQ